MKEKKPQEEDGVRVLPPDFTLKKTVGNDVDLHELFNEEVIEKAQNNIALKQESFFQWFTEDIDMPENTYRNL